MIINCRSEEFQNNPVRYRVLLDGREVHEVWFVDTDAGILKTYAVVEDAEAMFVGSLPSYLRARGVKEGWDMPPGGIVSKTLYGHIELTPFG